MRLTYRAVRDLAPGHDSDQDYTAIVVGQVIDRSTNISRSDNTALSGARDHALHNRLRRWSVQTDWLTGQALLEFDEFLGSVSGGEPFIFDPDGDTAAVSPTPVTLLTTRQQRRRANPGGQPHFAYTIEVEERV